MKKLLFILAAFLSFGIAHAATPIQTANARGAGTSLSIAFTTQNVTPGDTLVLEVYTATSAPTSVTESASETVNTRVPWGGSSFADIAAYDVLPSESPTKVGFTINVATSQNVTAILAEYPPTGAFNQSTVIASGGASPASSASLTPAVSGELAIGMLGANNNGTMTTTWLNGYVNEASRNSNGGGAPTIYLADQVLSGTSPIVASATLSSGVQWSMMELLYKPAGGGSCTHKGLDVTGNFTVPNGTSGLYWLSTGKYGTPSCSGPPPYFQQQGSFGTN